MASIERWTSIKSCPAALDRVCLRLFMAVLGWLAVVYCPMQYVDPYVQYNCRKSGTFSTKAVRLFNPQTLASHDLTGNLVVYAMKLHRQQCCRHICCMLMHVT